MSSSTDERRATLKAALVAAGLELRDDSGLCRAYIESALDECYTPELIAFICGLHRFLYEHTDYPSRCAEIIPRVARGLAPCMGGYAAALAYARRNETPILKAEALAKYGLPEVWPWLPQTTTPL
jgi:hypothetical protein